MGANNSTDAAEIRAKYGSSYSQGKPSIPEGIPKITDITHNSITLSWLSSVNSGRILAYQVECCNLRDRKWRIITSTCQGTTYHVKNLAPETCYMFRVRAENLSGQSKPGIPTEEIRTRPVPTNYLEEKPVTKLVRRHSHYLKLDSGLNNLLNKTETDEVDSGNNVGSIPFRRNSTRGSLPPGFRTKRNSVTSFLPGSKRESICNFKESKKSFEESSIAEEENLTLNLKRISTSSTEASSIFSSNSMTSIVEDDELSPLYGQPDCSMCCDNDDAYSTTNSHITTSSGFSSASSRSSHSSHSHHSTHNALVHTCPTVNENSSILTASITDDNKMDYISNPEKNCKKSQYLVSRNNAKLSNPNAGKTIFEICDNEIWKGRIENQSNETSPQNNESQRNINITNRNSVDLRSIRNMLNSQDVMVKTLDNSKRTSCAIKEIDEDITVDIVSTL